MFCGLSRLCTCSTIFTSIICISSIFTVIFFTCIICCLAAVFISIRAVWIISFIIRNIILSDTSSPEALSEALLSEDSVLEASAAVSSLLSSLLSSLISASAGVVGVTSSSGLQLALLLYHHSSSHHVSYQARKHNFQALSFQT